MILQLFLSLIVMAAFAFLVVPRRGRRLWSLLILVLGAGLMYYLFTAFAHNEISSFVYPWINYPSLQADFYLAADTPLERMLLPLLGIALLLIYLNIIYKPESHKFSLNGIILLSLAAFIMLFSARDFIQLMAGSCLFTVMGFYLIDQMEAKKKFIFYNFLAEMALFTALAVVYGSLRSVSLTFTNYNHLGAHRDLVAALVLLVLLLKAGLFMFQNQFLDLQGMTFNRVMSVSFMSTPLTALVLLVKLRPLLNDVDFARPVLLAFLLLSVLWGFFGTLLIDNIKAKALYLNQMFFAFALTLVYYQPETLYNTVVQLMTLVMLLNILFLITVQAASNETFVSQMGGFVRRLKFNFLLTLLGVFAFAAALYYYYQPPLTFIYGAYGALTLIACAHVFRQIFLGSDNADERVSALLENAGITFWLPLLAGSTAVIVCSEQWKNPAVYLTFAVFLLLLTTGSLRFLNRWYANEALQEADFFEKLYHYLILMPIRLLGRILWIAVDFVVIERTVIGSVSQTTRFLVNGLCRIQCAVWLNYLLLVLFGLAVMMLTIGYYCYE